MIEISISLIAALPMTIAFAAMLITSAMGKQQDNRALQPVPVRTRHFNRSNG